MTAATLIVAAIVLCVGLMIGAIGIGGMFMVPAMTHLGGMDIHVAIATAMLTYSVAGAVAVLAFSRRGSIAWRQSVFICLGTIPGAFLGAVTVVHVPGWAVEVIIASLTLFSGAHALHSNQLVEPRTSALRAPLLVTLGFIVGFGSAASGTGGPLILLPILVWLRVPILIALGSAHMSQITISLVATTGNVLYGEIDYEFGLIAAMCMGVGVGVGVLFAHRIPVARLRKIVAVGLVLTGVGLFMALGWRLMI